MILSIQFVILLLCQQKKIKKILKILRKWYFFYTPQLACNVDIAKGLEGQRRTQVFVTFDQKEKLTNFKKNKNSNNLKIWNKLVNKYELTSLLECATEISHAKKWFDWKKKKKMFISHRALRLCADGLTTELNSVPNWCKKSYYHFQN